MDGGGGQGGGSGKRGDTITFVGLGKINVRNFLRLFVNGQLARGL